MNFLAIISLIQTLVPYVGGSHGYFYQLENAEVEKQGIKRPNFRSLHRCSLNKNCSDLAKDKKTGKLKEIKGEKEREKAMEDGDVLWTKIPLKLIYPLQKKDAGLIQVGARNSQFASVTVDVPQGKYIIKLVHHSGFLSCTTLTPADFYKTTFGCLFPPWNWNKVDILVTDSSNKELLPKAKGYSHDGRFSKTAFVVYNDVIELYPGQQLRFWDWEDLGGSLEGDNSGISKFYVYAILQH